MNKDIKLKNSLELLLTAVIWGFAFVAQSVSMDYVGAFTFICARNLIGAVVLLPVLFFMKKKKASPKTSDGSSGDQSSFGKSSLDGSAFRKSSEHRTLLTGGIVCGIFLCSASYFQQIGIKYTTVGKAGFLTACYIIIVPVLGLFLKRKCSPFIWAAVLLALAGLYLLCISDGFSIARGDIFVLICAFLFAFQILSVDHFSPKVNGAALSCLQFLVCGLISMVLMFIFEHPSWSALWAARVPVLYAGVLSTGVAYTLQIIGQKGMNPTVASLIMSLESCISVIAGWLILGQSLSLREGIGCIVMFAAIIIAQL